MTEDRLAELMVKVTDGLATPSESAELSAHLASHPELAAELDAHVALRVTTDALVDRLHLDADLDALEASSSNRALQSTALALVLGGTLVLGLGASTTLLMDPELPWWLKAGFSLLGAGGLLFTGLAARAWWTSRSDPYNEVIR